MANQRIRDAAKDAGVKLWEVAAAVGINDGNLSRKLRTELPEAEQKKLLEAIEKIKKERGR